MKKIKAIFRDIPLNHTQNYTEEFDSVEECIRKKLENPDARIVSI